jgi:hypothetical protein
MRRQVKKNIPVMLTTKVTKATLEGSNDGSSGDFGPVGPAPLIDGGGSSENSHSGGDGAGLGKSEGTAGILEGNTT